MTFRNGLFKSPRHSFIMAMSRMEDTWEHIKLSQMMNKSRMMDRPTIPAWLRRLKTRKVDDISLCEMFLLSSLKGTSLQ